MKTSRSYRVWIFPINAPRLAWLLTVAALIAYDAKSHHAIATAIAHYLLSLREIK